MASTDDKRLPDDPAFAVELVGRVAAVPSILQVVRAVTGMRYVAVTRVTDQRWIACSTLDELAFGVGPGDELDLHTTLCHEVRGCRSPIIFDDAQGHPRYGVHPTPAQYGFRSYLSVPIVLADGQFFGTLCAIDPEPAHVESDAVTQMVTLFAQLIGLQLGDEAVHAQTSARLADERSASALREQFIAVLGHDLRNPLASLRAGIDLLARTELDAKTSALVARLSGSVSRMTLMIDDLYDFARGRLGDGLALRLENADTLAAELDQVIAELRSTVPERDIEVDIELSSHVECDPVRLGQLTSNLLGNAIRHGAAEHPIQVRVHADAQTFELSVANRGPVIPAERLEHLFEPFVRPSHQGLGLGLYISHQIAIAHGGTLTCESAHGETRFTFTMPARRDLRD